MNARSLPKTIHQWEVWKKAEHSKSIYWGCGQAVNVLESPRFDDKRRFLCLTDLENDCEHVLAVRQYINNTIPENATV